METENTPDIHGKFDVTDVDAEIKKQQEAEENEWQKQIKTTKERLAQEEAAASKPEEFAQGTEEFEQLSDEDLEEVVEEKN